MESRPTFTRRDALVAVAASSGAAAATGLKLPLHTGAASDFDFLKGVWNVRHRRIAPGGNDWTEFPGTMRHHRLVEGAANAEEYHIAMPGRPYDALAVRTFDSKARMWSIWWFDSRYPELGLGTPVRGGFSGDTGLFFAEEQVDGRPGLLRFVWQRFSDGRARWEQALSIDGQNWSPNWTMEFTRA